MSKQADIAAFEQGKKNLPEFRVGDTLRISLRVVEEGGKERVQAFSGTCIARKGSGISETISVHRVAHGEGMERVFFLHSPLITSVEVVRRGSVRRAKLYYLRGTSGKKAKVRGRAFSATAAAPVEESQPETA